MCAWRDFPRVIGPRSIPVILHVCDCLLLLISSQICEEFDQKKPEGQDKPQRLGKGLIYTVGEGVNVYSR